MASNAVGSKPWRDELAADDEDDRLDTGVRARRTTITDAWHLRCVRGAPEGSVAAILPDRVTVLPDGTAIAHYPGDGTMRYCDLAHLMAHHELGIADFEEDPTG